MTDEMVRAALLDLLAVIHGDGGHHTAEVGFLQSIADAKAVVLRSRGELHTRSTP